MELRKKLKEMRASRGVTQEEAGEYLGVSAQTVSKWERGLLSPDTRSTTPTTASVLRK